MLAGGIVVTPFRAMTMQATHERLPHRLYLFYSNRHLDDAAFLSELLQLQEINPNFRMIATLSEPRKSSHPWAGETGVIQRDMLKRHVSNLEKPVYYFAGSPAMTAAMQQMLETIGIDEQAMRYEEFYGY